jgi:hypothetical protein
MPVEEQVVSIYAGTNGFLDDLAVDDVRAFETALLRYVRASRPELLEHIRTTREMPDASDLESAIREVKQGFATAKPEPPKPGKESPAESRVAAGDTEDAQSEATPAGAAPSGGV